MLRRPTARDDEYDVGVSSIYHERHAIQELSQIGVGHILFLFRIVHPAIANAMISFTIAPSSQSCIADIHHLHWRLSLP